MLTKEKLIQTIEALPEGFTTEDVIDRVILLSKIDLGIEQTKQGKALSTEQAKEKLKKWLE